MDLTDPQQWHGYAYASNNPLTNSDPSGLLRARPGAGSVKQTMRRQTPHERRLEPAMQEPGTRTGWLDDIDWETVAKGVMLGLAVVGIAAACIGSAGGFCAIAAGVGGAMSLTATEAVVAGTVVVAAGYLAIQGPSLSNSSPLMLNESSGTGANSSGNAHISPAREEHIAGNHGPGVQEEVVTRGYETADIPGEFLDDFLYNSNDELVVGQRIEEAVNRAPRPRLPNPNGPGEIINVDFGEIVGNAGGGRCSPTSWVQVVIRGGNNIWTAYPIVAP